GSGNDFAKALGIKTDAIALQAWKSFCTGAGNVREIDLGVVRKGGDETFFCCVAGAGLDSAANARANRMPAWLRGSVGYVLAAVQALIATRSAKIKLSTAEQTIERAAWFVAAGNAHRYGGGFKVVPQASLDDGYLDICFVGKMNKVKVACCLPLIYWGAHTRLREVECLRAKSAVIESERPLDLYADGEYVCQTPVEIGLISKGLRVIVPLG
ncbi:MAG TPA: hypothetical protein VEW69_04650, partial [Alphaproteobacteria bacterium]|nr:hypothetical protein [Alphaproteobacteria bacterium]